MTATAIQVAEGIAKFDKTVIIANGATDSSEVDLVQDTCCGIILPASMTGTSVSFKASDESGGTFRTVKKDGVALSYTSASNDHIILQPADFAGIRFLKVVSGSAETGAKTIIIVRRRV